MTVSLPIEMMLKGIFIKGRGMVLCDLYQDYSRSMKNLRNNYFIQHDSSIEAQLHHSPALCVLYYYEVNKTHIKKL